MAIKGYWRLNGNSNDASGNGNNGTDTNITYSQANGRLNQGAAFNDISSKIVITDNSSLKPANTFTISAWIKKSSTTTGGDFIFCSENELQVSPYNYAGFRLYIYVLASGYYDIIFQTGNYSASKFSISIRVPYSDLDNKWINITAKCDGTYGYIYLNGIEKAKAANSYLPTYQSSNFVRIGCRGISTGSNDLFFKGAIDEVILDSSSIALSQLKNKLASDKGFF